MTMKSWKPLNTFLFLVLAFGAGALLTWFIINLRRDRILTRISVRLVPGTNFICATIPPGRYSCGLSFKPDPLQARSDTEADVPGTSLERVVIRRKGVLLFETNAISRFSFGFSDASFALTELSVVVTQDCFVHCGPAN